MNLTKEQLNISMDNRRKAWDYFVSIGEIPKDAGRREYDLHHIDETLRHTNIERYILWLPEDLVVMTHAEHTRHHHKGKIVSAETREKLRKAQTGRKYGEETREKHRIASIGRIFSEESRKKISEAVKGHRNTAGKKWFNNGAINTRALECPEGFVPGRLKKETA